MVYATRMRYRWVILLVLGAGCAQDLPSTIPLGRGPLAEDERPGAPERPRRPARSQARPKVSHLRGYEPPLYRDLDAGLDARDIDAAAPDASARADALPDAVSVLAGHYEGWDITIKRVQGFPDLTEKDPNAKTDVEEQGKDRIAITLINSATGTPICTLDADVRGGTGTLRPGQPCFDEDDASTSLVSGTAKFAGRQLLLDMRLDLRGGYRGEIEYHFDGTRK